MTTALGAPGASTARKYGKRKVKRNLVPIVVAEPHRKSLYQVIVSNMTQINRVTFIHRLIIIGRHRFNSGEFNNIGANFSENIEAINGSYHEEYLTGYLLHYATYFMHVIDGCEEALNAHVHHLFTNEDCVKNLSSLKLLCAFHHINQRFLRIWTDMSAKPPHLLQKINSDLDVNEVKSKIKHCIGKLYKLGLLLRAANEDDDEESSSTVTDLHTATSSNLINKQRAQSMRLPNKVKTVRSHYSDISRPLNCLPEQQLLEFLLETPHTQDLSFYAAQFQLIPSIESFKEKCWPLLTDYVPQNIFDSEIDPVVDIKKEEVVEEESFAGNAEDLDIDAKFEGRSSD